MQVVVNVFYALDEVGDKNPENPENPDIPDNVPDMYQVEVTYEAVNGTVDVTGTQYVTIYENGDPTGNWATPSEMAWGHLTEEQIADIAARVNAVIEADMPVTYEYVRHDAVPADVPLDKLPDTAEDVLRLVRVGDYDVCACIGAHVEHTAQIGRFRISSTSYKDGQFRIVFRLADVDWD